MKPLTITIYTDGACEPNPGPGGWGAILHYQLKRGIHEQEISGGHIDTTNNRMEITGVIEALKLLEHPCDVTIFSDSKYVVNGIGGWSDGEPIKKAKGWMVGWREYGWRRKEGQLQNIDLWQTVDRLVRIQKSVNMRWVRGHSGHEFNERCDILASQARRLILDDHMGDRLQRTQIVLGEDAAGADIRKVDNDIQQSRSRSKKH